MIKAIGLLSGGLDSTLAVKMMIGSGIEVLAVNFVSPFCLCTKNGCQHQATQMSKKLGINIKVFSKGKEYLDIIKKPKYGYGKNMNPCIDCRIFMFKKTKEYMDHIGASFVFTGEVLGQRPMSQRKKVMYLIDRESGLVDLVLRPLSAALLKPTIPEKKGWITRDELLDLNGRSRKPQFKLAEQFNITDHFCPAGGCRLTDPKFSLRLKESFSHEEHRLVDIKLLKYGRHFRLEDGAKVVVGRNQQENLVLVNLAESDDWLLEAEGGKSPVALLKKSNGERSSIETAASICLQYAKYDSENPKIRVFNKPGYEALLNGKPISFKTLAAKRID